MRIFTALLLLVAIAAPAQTPAKKPAHKPAAPAAELKFVLIVSRHGIRPPLQPNSTLNQFSAQPWPEWEVPLGELTPHGVQAIEQMGQYLRLRYVEDGLFPPGGCPTPADLYLYSDTDHRNIDSTRATFAAFAPNCDHIDINMMAPNPTGARDPLFNTVPGTFATPPAAAAEAALRAALHANPDFALTVRGNPELKELAHILAPDPARQPAKPILSQPTGFKPGTYGMTTTGPLAAASSLIEDLELEFVDAKPLTQVGWGRLGDTDEAADTALLRLMPLHVKAFGLGLRTPLYARSQGSSLLAHLLATLNMASKTPAEQLAQITFGSSMGTTSSSTSERLKDVWPVGPAGVHFVYLSAHDSNIFTLGGLLGLHWRADSHSDDTPPDSQLAFELWQRPGSSGASHTAGANENDYDIRIVYRAQTLAQLRSAETLSLQNPPAEVELTPTGCVAHRPCPLATFLAAAARAIDPAYVKPDLVPVTLAP
jgi:4-phytase/acid phosphatase